MQISLQKVHSDNAKGFTTTYRNAMHVYKDHQPIMTPFTQLK